jgi:hypothetical protein
LCRRLAEAGCSANEIAAISGHTTLHEVERYTKAADQQRMAGAAFERLKNDRATNREESIYKPQPNRLKLLSAKLGMVAEAVLIGPVSVLFSLLTGKITGNFRKITPLARG